MRRKRMTQGMRAHFLRDLSVDNSARNCTAHRLLILVTPAQGPRSRIH